MSIEKALEKRFRDEVKDSFVYPPSKLKTDSNNASLLSSFYRQNLKGYNANIAGLRDSFPTHIV